MSTNRSHLAVLLTVTAVSIFVGAGSVLAAMPRTSAASALADYDFDTPALKRTDLDRALAAGGASPDRVVVTYTGGFADQATLARVHQLVGGTQLSGDGVLGREVFRLASGDAASVVLRLHGVAGVSEARVEQTVSVDAGPLAAPVPLPELSALGATNDPYASYAWGVTRVGANLVWGTSTGSGVKVAVLDCGIHRTHPDLAGQVVVEKNFSSSATVDDKCNHGTHVAGTVAALTNNGLGVPSVAPGVRLMNGKVMDDNGHGLFTDFENGMRWAADNGAKVVNMSLGADIPCPASTQAAVNYARAKGVVLVAASGNSGLSHAAAPANCAGVVSVGAVDQSEARASFSNAGTGVALAAPGVSIGSTLNPDINGGALYGSGSGTSMASPHVAGVAALVWASKYGTSADAVVNRLESTAEHTAGTGSLWTYGRVSALKAVGAPPAAATPTTAPATAFATSTRVPATATGIPTRSPVVAALTETPVTVIGLPTPKPKPTLTPVATAPATRVPSSPTPIVTRLTTSPTSVSAVPLGHGQVQVFWQATVDSQVTFTVYRGDASGLDMRRLIAGLPSTTKTFIDATAPVGQTVTYSVAEQNATGEGPRSAPVRNASTIR